MPQQIAIALIGALAGVAGVVTVEVAKWVFGLGGRKVNNVAKLTEAASTLIDQLQEEARALKTQAMANQR